MPRSHVRDVWPWGHAAVGYLLASGLARGHGGRPRGRETLVVVGATLLPDIVDKPLA